MIEMTESRRWWIAIAVMLVTVMEMLDMTIVNVALPQMMGSLSATTEQITWVLTSYVVSAAIVMPLSGFLINRWGAKRLLLFSITGFLAASMLCGMATSLTMIVVFRVLQGVFGASLVPLSQFVLRYTFPVEQLTKAMAIWGVGIMTGPILGPTLGGFITEAFNWRWLFYINLPVCLIALAMCWKLIEETPRQKKDIDWLGVILLASGIGALQIFLDRGNSIDWFSAPSIRWLFGIALGSLVVFTIRGLHIKNNIINLHLFRYRNFSVGCLLLAIFAASALGTVTLQPLFMERLLNYPVQFAGIVMAPRGIASAIAMAMTPQLVKYVDERLIVFIGVVFGALSTALFTHLNLQVDATFLVWAGAVQGFGMGLFFVPVSKLAFQGLSQQEYAEATGLFSFWRSLGTSIGVSLLSTLLTRESQANWNVLNAQIQPFNPNLHYWLAQQHATLQQSTTLGKLTLQISQQSSLLGFLDAFFAVMVGYIVMVPLIGFLRKT